MSEYFIINFIGLKVIGFHKIHRDNVQFDLILFYLFDNVLKMSLIEICLSPSICK